MLIEMQRSVIFLIIIILSGVMGGEEKPAHAQALCGNQFLLRWKVLCQIESQKKSNNLHIELKSMMKEQKHFLLKANTAKKFLNPLKRKRRSIFSGKLDNADEECCKEKCVNLEILEYPC
ncbi:uncharacterized protein LOC100205786 isoform X2 [Hydra vulgaris]|uniref:Uncharacterized protein LOC100205786 isoform X2 n=1 Tax=Hydra vulgaris TaxID=6087 RepID=A0ABM4D8E4_HYDVU